MNAHCYVCKRQFQRIVFIYDLLCLENNILIIFFYFISYVVLKILPQIIYPRKCLFNIFKSSKNSVYVLQLCKKYIMR